MRRAFLAAIFVLLAVTQVDAGGSRYPFGYYGPFHRYPFAYRYYTYQPRPFPLHLWSTPYGSTFLIGQPTAYDWVFDEPTVNLDEVPTGGLPPMRMRDPAIDPFGW